MTQRLHSFRAASTFEGVAKLYNELPAYTEKAHGVYIDRERDDTARSLSLHGKPYVNLRPVKTAQGVDGFAARYHDTDVVVWEPNRVTIEGWPSLSTNTLADDFTPWCLRFEMHHDNYEKVVRVEMPPGQAARCYTFSDTIAFEPVPNCDNRWWMPIDAPKTDFYVVDAKVQRAALTKHKYQEFMLWARAYLHMNNAKPVRLTDEADEMRRRVPVVDLLDDPNNWWVLTDNSYMMPRHERRTWMHVTYSPLAHLEYMLDVVRKEIYERERAVFTRSVEWYEWSQFPNQRRLAEKFSWAMPEGYRR